MSDSTTTREFVDLPERHARQTREHGAWNNHVEDVVQRPTTDVNSVDQFSVRLVILRPKTEQ